MPRARRSCLTVPGDDERKLARAAAVRADEVILDLEDAVAPARKDEARAIVERALRDLRFAATTVAIRINRGSIEDLALVRAVQPDVVVLPKVESPDELAGATRSRGGADRDCARARRVRADRRGARPRGARARPGRPRGVARHPGADDRRRRARRARAAPRPRRRAGRSASPRSTGRTSSSTIPRGLRRAAHALPRSRLRRQVVHPPRAGGDLQRGVRAHAPKRSSGRGGSSASRASRGSTAR